MAHGTEASQAAQKIAKLAAVFVNIATVYVESREQETLTVPSAASVQDQPNVYSIEPSVDYPMPDWAPLSPFFDAFGLARDLSQSSGQVTDTNASLDNWFMGNQQIIGLLEDDLSFLDSVALG